LEERVARMCGKEDAMFTVSGTLTNRELSSQWLRIISPAVRLSLLDGVTRLIRKEEGGSRV
jgi:hypothetical protein